MEITDNDVALVDQTLQTLLLKNSESTEIGCFYLQHGLLTLNYAGANGPCPDYFLYSKLLAFMKDQELLVQQDGAWSPTEKANYIVQTGGFKKFFEDEVAYMEKAEERQKIKRRFNRLKELLSSRKYWWFWLLLLLIGIILLTPVLLALFIDNN